MEGMACIVGWEYTVMGETDFQGEVEVQWGAYGRKWRSISGVFYIC